MSNGKESKRRPMAISKEEFDRSWEEVFGKPRNDTEAAVERLAILEAEALRQGVGNREIMEGCGASDLNTRKDAKQ